MLPNLEFELDSLRNTGRYRTTRRVETAQEPRIRIDGRDMRLFCSNNYLGLANHSALKTAAIQAIERYGCSTVASALISGHMQPHQELEQKMASFLQTEAALAFPTGYMANLGAITALVGPEDIIFSDQLNHRSIIDGCRLSRARTIVYNHRDTDHLDTLLKKEIGRRRLIVTDGLFSMHGDFAPLPELVALSQTHRAILMVDDAHGTGALGPTGRGTHEHFSVPIADIDVLMTAGSKGLGAFGGFIAGREDLIHLLHNRAASYIYTTALPPDACAATSAALDLIDTHPEIRTRLWQNVERTRNGLLKLDFNLMDSKTQIIPIHIGDTQKTTAISQHLYERGVFLYGIRPPTVPEGQSRLRLSVMASHSADDITHLLDALAEVRQQFL